MTSTENIQKNDLVLTLADLQVDTSVDKKWNKRKWDTVDTYFDRITKGQIRINEIPLLQKTDLEQLLSKLPPDKAEALKIAQAEEVEYRKVNRAVASWSPDWLGNLITQGMGTVSKGYETILGDLAKKEKTSEGADKKKILAFSEEVKKAAEYAKSFTKKIYQVA